MGPALRFARSGSAADASSSSDSAAATWRWLSDSTLTCWWSRAARPEGVLCDTLADLAAAPAPGVPPSLDDGLAGFCKHDGIGVV